MTYNERSAKKWGWDPSWFGAAGFGPELKDKIKAWHLHKEATLNYVCVYGKVKLVLFDNRKASKSFGEYQEIFLSFQYLSAHRSRISAQPLVTVPWPNGLSGWRYLLTTGQLRYSKGIWGHLDLGTLGIPANCRRASNLVVVGD